MTYEEKMALLRAKAKREDAARRQQQERETAVKMQRQREEIARKKRAEAIKTRVFSLSQINEMLDKTEKRIQRRAKQWESEGIAQPVEIAKPDPFENSD
jgi:hypothetical protein